MATRIRIQPSTLPDLSSPYPWVIHENGDVEDQPFWNGDPAALVGFQSRFDDHELTLLLSQWWADPQRAVGMYPVFVATTGPDGPLEAARTYVHQVAISEVLELPDRPGVRRPYLEFRDENVTLLGLTGPYRDKDAAQVAYDALIEAERLVVDGNALDLDSVPPEAQCIFVPYHSIRVIELSPQEIRHIR